MSSINDVEESIAEITSLSLNDEKKVVTLTSSDNVEVVVEESAVLRSETIKNILEDCELKSIPIQNVNGKTLHKIVQYCNKHYHFSTKPEELEKFDEKFLDVDQSKLLDLIMAANYQAMKDLVSKVCKKVASMIKGKTVEQIRETFQVENDFKPDQEEEIRAENSWAFV